MGPDSHRDDVRSYFGQEHVVSAFKSSKKHNLRSRYAALKELLDGVDVEQALDVGCGGGAHAELILEHAQVYKGVDIVPQMLMAATHQSMQRGHDDRSEFVVGDATSLPFRSDIFDLVLAVGLLEYFKDPHSLLEELSRIQSDDGILILHSYSPYPYYSHCWPLFRPVYRFFRRDDINHHRRPKETVDNITAEYDYQLRDWRHTNHTVLPLPLNLLLYPLHIGIAKGLRRFRPRGLGYFAVNYIGKYERS